MAGSEGTTSWNELSSQLVVGKFATGKVNIDEVMMPVNVRGHPIDVKENYRSLGTGIGLFFSAKKPCQTLAVLETRYLNMRDAYPYGTVEQDLARAIVNLWCDEHFIDNTSKGYAPTDEEIDKAFTEYLRDIKACGYAERFDRTGGIDSNEGRVVRFHLKSTFKPKLSPDYYKVGQGISA